MKERRSKVSVSRKESLVSHASSLYIALSSSGSDQNWNSLKSSSPTGATAAVGAAAVAAFVAVTPGAEETAAAEDKAGEESVDGEEDGNIGGVSGGGEGRA